MTEMVFTLITFLTFLLFYFGTGRDKRLLIISFVWLFTIGTLSFYGYFEDTTTIPTRFLIILLGSISFIVFFSNKLNATLVNNKLILLLHSLRLPIEVCLLQLYFEKQIPVIMTFYGYNFDIVIGISALFIVLYKKHSKIHKLLYFWNIAGVIFLSIIACIAILSAPLPLQQFAFEQPNIALLKFPYVFLPAFIVPLVFTSHFLMLKKRKNNSDF